MTKKKLNETIVELCVAHKASAELTNALDELTKPKVGGSSDVNDYTVFNGEDVEFIFCTYHKKWEPVATEVEDEDGEVSEVPLFKANAKSKNGYERACNEALAQWREQAKTFKVTNDAVVKDLLEGEIDNIEAKALIADAEAARAVHVPRADGLGEDDKPEA